MGFPLLVGKHTQEMGGGDNKLCHIYSIKYLQYQQDKMRSNKSSYLAYLYPQKVCAQHENHCFVVGTGRPEFKS